MGKRKMFVLLGIGCVVLGLVVTPYVALDAEAAEPPKPLLIGGVTHLTGSSAFFGKTIKMGADLAVEEYNAKGGILGGRQVVIKWEDDKCNPTEAVSAFRKLHAEGISLFTGLSLSGDILAINPAAKAMNCIFVNPSSQHPKAAGDGTTWSVQCAAPVIQGAHLERLMKRFNPKSVYLVHVNDEYGRSVHAVAKPFFYCSWSEDFGRSFSRSRRG